MVFAALHLPALPGSEELHGFHFLDVSWLFATGLLLGGIAVHNRNNIVIPIAIHAAMNAAGLGLLAWAFWQYG